MPEVKLMYYGVNNQQLYHNTAAFLFNATSLLDSIAVGTTNYQRIGSQLRLKKLVARFLFNNKEDRPNVTYRFIVGALPESSTSDVLPAEMFATGSTTPIITAPVFPGIVKIYADQYIGGGQHSVTPIASTLKERSFHHTFELDMDAVVRYNGAVCTTRLFFAVVAYDAYGTLTTDNIASVASQSVGMYFTDE